MNLLLDTHALIWSISEDRSVNLSEQVADLLKSTDNNCFVSIASLWEIAIKYSLDRLELPVDLNAFFLEIEKARFELLPITIHHIAALASLPLLHKDPFDRLLIAQAQVENLTLVSKDRYFQNYGVPVIW